MPSGDTRLAYELGAEKVNPMKEPCPFLQQPGKVEKKRPIGEGKKKNTLTTPMSGDRHLMIEKRGKKKRATGGVNKT